MVLSGFFEMLLNIFLLIFLLGIYLAMEMLGHVVTSSYILKNSQIIFGSGSDILYIYVSISPHPQ